MIDDPVPLCVDFDGTLTATSVRLEQALTRAQQSPTYLLKLRSALSSTALPLSESDIHRLPLRHDVIAWLQLERRAGRRLILVMDGDQASIDAVAAYLGLFDGAARLADQDGPLAERKQRTLVARFGERGFDYVGSRREDELVWKAARRAIVIGDRRLANRVGRVADVSRVFPPTRPTVSAWLSAIRLHQWVKNTLVFLPALLGHARPTPQLLGSAALAFIGFGLCASSVYLTNDLFDLSADRAHTRKRTRPIAAGVISPPAAVVASLLLLSSAAGIALIVNATFALLLLCYYLLTCAYSLRLKRVVLLDVIILAVLYTIRIIAGGAATAVPVSSWLLAFSMFFFLSLAFVKRVTELKTTRRRHPGAASGRGYTPGDMPIIGSLGMGAGLGAIAVLALYIGSPEAQALYRHRQLLWLVCPLLFFWMGRAWLLATRGVIHDDPVVFAVRDPVSLLIFASLVLIVSLSS